MDNSLRDDIKDAIRGQLETEECCRKCGHDFSDSLMDELKCSIADVVFEVLGISDKEQDSTKGGQWHVYP